MRLEYSSPIIADQITAPCIIIIIYVKIHNNNCLMLILPFRIEHKIPLYQSIS